MSDRELTRRGFMAATGGTAAWMMGTGRALSEPIVYRGRGPSRLLAADEDPGPPFSVAEYGSRLQRVRERMAKEKIDLLYLTLPEDIFYLHGFQTNWYRSNAPLRTGVSGTAVHVAHDHFIHFEVPYESDLIAATSVSQHTHFFEGD